VKSFIIFTHGAYRTEHLNFYRKLCRSKIKIAVDGGLRFFLKTHIIPDLLIGDLDSLPRGPKDLSRRTKVLTFPARKDKTDLQLAFEYCLSEKAKSIEIIDPIFGQLDHFLGNVMLVNLIDKLTNTGSSPRVRFITARYEIIFVSDQPERFVDCNGDIVSVIPLSESILLTCSGTEYDVRHAEIRGGHTRGLRNRIVSQKATFDIRGKAFVIHRIHA